MTDKDGGPTQTIQQRAWQRSAGLPQLTLRIYSVTINVIDYRWT
jgi:hypothetical protein